MLSIGTRAPGRSRPGRSRFAGAGGAVSASLLLAACGGGSSSPSPADAGKSTSGASGAAAPAKSGEKVTINWFVGLGTGADPGQPAAQQKVVDAFNKSQDHINLKMTVVNHNTAADALATQVSGGNAPDLVGPVGIQGANQFYGNWLDLAPLVKSTNFDTSIWNPDQLKAQQDADGTQAALPFGIYPSMIWYNKDLFDEAGIKYPPAKFGEKYADGSEWNTEKLRELALKLTVDKAGNDATSPKFDPKSIVQWGYDPQYGEDGPQYNGSLFGAGSLVAADQKTAQIPAPWLAEWNWYYNLIWKDHAAPNKEQLASDQLGKGNAFATGKVAMAFTHTWYLCCMKDDAGKAKTFFDFAATPFYKGTQTAKLHTDSFRIFKTTKHPKETFEVLSYFLTKGAPDLTKIYNAVPAISSQQDAYFSYLDETWTQHPNWDVVKEAATHPDVPNHEAFIPNYNKSGLLVKAMGQKLLATPGLNVDAEAAKLKVGLQKLYDAAK